MSARSCVLALAAVITVLQGLAGCGDVRREPITGPAARPPPDAGSGGGGSPAHCRADADCGSAASRCDLSSGTCVECLENEDCPASNCENCGPSDAVLCHPNQLRCVECVTDGHCTSVGERCSIVLGVCATPCATPSVCPEDEPVCDTVVGFCVGCTRDEDCDSETPYCRRSECTR